MLACFRHGLYWRGITHDLSKLNLTKEFIPYARFFYSDNKPIRDGTGYYKPHDTGNDDFEQAWFHHVKHNSHHWQYHCVPKDKDVGGVTTHPMKDKDILEMICDWEGAGIAQKAKTNPRQWYEINKHHLLFHPVTKLLLEKTLWEWFSK
jgi:hypothetical protein